MRKIAENIWAEKADFRFMGAEFGKRMTIIQLANQELLIHSPIKANDKLFEAINRLGKVAYIITPNNFHVSYTDDWCRKYPNASHYSAKQSDSKHTSVLSEYINDVVDSEIKIIKINGVSRINEFAFYHKLTGTLVLTDLAFNIRKEVSLWSRIFFRLYGVYGHFGPSRFMKAMITEPDKLEATISRILRLELNRVIVSHGDILESNARQLFIHAFGDCYNVNSIGRNVNASCG